MSSNSFPISRCRFCHKRYEPNTVCSGLTGVHFCVLMTPKAVATTTVTTVTTVDRPIKCDSQQNRPKTVTFVTDDVEPEWFSQVERTMPNYTDWSNNFQDQMNQEEAESSVRRTDEDPGANVPNWYPEWDSFDQHHNVCIYCHMEVDNQGHKCCNV